LPPGGSRGVRRRQRRGGGVPAADPARSPVPRQQGRRGPAPLRPGVRAGRGDRQAISEAVIAWAHGGFALGLADTAASFLQGADRLPDDRLRAAQYRLAIRAALGRWAEGYAAWDSVA